MICFAILGGVLMAGLHHCFVFQGSVLVQDLDTTVTTKHGGNACEVSKWLLQNGLDVNKVIQSGFMWNVLFQTSLPHLNYLQW